MGWTKSVPLVGDRRLDIVFSRHGSLNRHLDTGSSGEERLRLSGKRVRVVLRKTTWDDLNDEQRQARLHERD
jgi:hypothetical protein